MENYLIRFIKLKEEITFFKKKHQEFDVLWEDAGYYAQILRLFSIFSLN